MGEIKNRGVALWSSHRRHFDPTGRLMAKLSFSGVFHRMRSKALRLGPTAAFIEWVWTVRT